MGFFTGIEKAQPTSGGVYIIPGVYRLKVLSCKMQISRQQEWFFIAEFEVLESSTAERPIGSRMSWMANAKHDNFKANVRNFIAQVEGVTLDDVDEEDAEAVVDPKVNPLAGETVNCAATNIKTKKGGDFTLCQWSPTTVEAAA